MMKEIDFIVFTSKRTEDSVHDIFIDLDTREFTIQLTDLYGKELETSEGGKLRRSKVAKFRQELEALDFSNWPLNERDTLPLNLKSASVIYNIGGEEGEEYYTTGPDTESLRKLHQAVEKLINTTIGSYIYY